MAHKSNANMELPISIDNEYVKEVNSFKYLGAEVAFKNVAKTSLNARICKAKAAFHSLKALWRNKTLTLGLKIQIYKTMVRTVLLYGLDTVPMTETENNRLDQADRAMARIIARKGRFDTVTNEAVYTRTKLKPISQHLQMRRMKWFGHVQRMPNHRYAKWAWKLGAYTGGKRKRGRPPTSYHKRLQRDFSTRGVTLEQAEIFAMDKPGFKALLGPPE